MLFVLPVACVQAQRIRTRLMVHYRRIFVAQRIDFVATPTTGTTAPIIRCASCLPQDARPAHEYPFCLLLQAVHAHTSLLHARVLC
jgi:hypothetical protein